MEYNDFLFAVRYWDIRDLHSRYRLQTIDCFRNLPFRLVTHILTDNLSLVRYTKHDCSAFPVQKGAKSFHSAFQLTGGLFELHLPIFLFGYQLFYYVEIFNIHMNW